jgi:hypothetical protein
MKLNFKLKYSKHKSLLFKANLARVNTPRSEFIKRNSHINHKVFCIGFGKTGTTSLEAALKEFGYQLGNQPVAELLAEDWYYKRTDRIIKFCHSANAFQDIPFGMPGLYEELDKSFPNSKFILTLRDNAEVWYNSLVKFHAKKFAKDGVSMPTKEELENSTYRYKGWALDMPKFLFKYPENELYNKEKYTAAYLNHIEEVKNYFKDRPNDLLVLNVSENGAYQKLAKFLGVEVDSEMSFPWLNKT